MALRSSSKRRPRHVTHSSGKVFHHQGGDLYRATDGSVLDRAVLHLLLSNEGSVKDYTASAEESHRSIELDASRSTTGYWSGTSESHGSDYGSSSGGDSGGGGSD